MPLSAVVALKTFASTKVHACNVAKQNGPLWVSGGARAARQGACQVLFILEPTTHAGVESRLHKCIAEG